MQKIVIITAVFVALLSVISCQQKTINVKEKEIEEATKRIEVLSKDIVALNQVAKEREAKILRIETALEQAKADLRPTTNEEETYLTTVVPRRLVEWLRIGGRDGIEKGSAVSTAGGS